MRVRPSPGISSASPVSSMSPMSGLCSVLRAERWKRTLCRAQRVENSVLPVARSPMRLFKALSCGLRPASVRRAAARSSARVSHSRKKSRERGSRNMNRARFSGRVVGAEDALVEGEAEAVGGHDVHAACYGHRRACRSSRPGSARCWAGLRPVPGASLIPAMARRPWPDRAGGPVRPRRAAGRAARDSRTLSDTPRRFPRSSRA